MALRFGRGNLFAGPPCVQPALAARNVPAGQVMAHGPDLWATDAGTLTLERVDRRGLRLHAVLRPAGGAPREVPLPAGADPRFLFAAGALAAVPIADAGGPREVAVLQLPSGAVVRRVALGEMRGAELISLGLAPDGGLAATAEGGGGQDGVAWAPAGAARFEVVRIADAFSQVRVAGGRIAMLVAGRGGDGQRVVVLEPVPGGEPRIVFRGPPAGVIGTLDFDGRHVAWASAGCQLVATADPASSRDTVPAGPCVRTEVWIGTFSPPLRGAERALRVSVNCLTSPDRRCRIRLRALDDRLRPLASRRASVPRGRERIVRIPLGSRAIARVRRGRTDPFVESRVIDPDGRSRIVSHLS